METKLAESNLSAEEAVIWDELKAEYASNQKPPGEEGGA